MENKCLEKAVLNKEMQISYHLNLLELYEKLVRGFEEETDPPEP